MAREDVTAIYTRNEQGDVVNVLEQRRAEGDAGTQEDVDGKEVEDAEKLDQLRKKLGIE